MSLALSSTIYNFDVISADADRQVYETLALRVAVNPSESEPYLLTRVLAYALEYTDGIGSLAGCSEPDEPAIFVRDLTGALHVWVESGHDDAERLHRAVPKRPARRGLFTQT